MAKIFYLFKKYLRRFRKLPDIDLSKSIYEAQLELLHQVYIGSKTSHQKIMAMGATGLSPQEYLEYCLIQSDQIVIKS